MTVLPPVPPIPDPAEQALIAEGVALVLELNEQLQDPTVPDEWKAQVHAGLKAIIDEAADARFVGRVQKALDDRAGSTPE